MLTLLKKLFGNDTGTDVRELFESGAVIIDVRTPQEYRGGHIKGSVNIPLQDIPKEINRLKKMGKPLITCCQSGGRSASAARVLSGQGITAYNGGGWQSLGAKLR